MKAKPLLLLVDDQRAMVEIMGTYFRLGGYEVMLAFDAETAWDLAHERVPDLAVLDLHLPGMNGNELADKMKADPLLKRVKIVFLATCAIIDLSSTLKLEGLRLFQKPFHPEELENLIEELLAPVEGGPR